MAKTDLTAARLRELFDYNPETGVFMRVAIVGRTGRTIPWKTRFASGLSITAAISASRWGVTDTRPTDLLGCMSTVFGPATTLTT